MPLGGITSMDVHMQFKPMGTIELYKFMTWSLHHCSWTEKNHICFQQNLGFHIKILLAPNTKKKKNTDFVFCLFAISVLI